MKKILFFCFALTLSFNVYAEKVAKPASPASVEKLMQLMEVEKMMDSMYAQMEGMFNSMVAQNGASEADKPIIEKYQQQLFVAMKEELSWAKMKVSMVKVYADNFTEEEISALTKFYSSPAGRAMTKKMPIVMRDSMQNAQEMVKGLIPKMQEISKNMAEELKAQHQVKTEK